ncbi:MAG: thioredoxin family protein [Candidatus Thorarchaeota archaeon]
MTMDVNPEVLDEITKTTKIVFVDTWAEWCAPCRALAPILEELDQKYADNKDVTFLKLNVDNHRSFAVKKNINAIPCVLVYYNGRPASFKMPNPMMGEGDEIDRIIGLRPAEVYEEVVEQLLQKE